MMIMYIIMPITGTQKTKLTRKDFLHLGEGRETHAGLGMSLLGRAARSAGGRRHLLLDLFAVVQVTGRAVSLHQRRLESQVLQRAVGP